MSSLNRYREVDVSGPPRELGRQIGEALGEQIRGFCEIALDRVNRTVAISRDAAMRVAHDAIDWSERYSPTAVEELRGTAEAARVTLDDLMLLQVRNQLRTPDVGCTSFSIAKPRREERIVAQNWDADPELDEFTVVLTRHPTGRPAFTSITQAGLIAYIGFNSAGIGLCANTLPAPCRQWGVPHYFLLRGIYEATDRNGAIEAVRRAERAMPANVILTTPQGPADLEITIENVHVLTDEGTGVVTHTNHCRHPEIVAINDSFPELIQSHARQQRIDLLLNECDLRATNADLSIEQVQRVLRDHQGHPRSICRHVNEDQPTGFWKTVFSVIIEPEKQQMQITRGNPCEKPYEVYRLS